MTFIQAKINGTSYFAAGRHVDVVLEIIEDERSDPIKFFIQTAS